MVASRKLEQKGNELYSNIDFSLFKTYIGRYVRQYVWESRRNFIYDGCLVAYAGAIVLANCILAIHM